MNSLYSIVAVGDGENSKGSAPAAKESSSESDGNT